MKYPGFLKIRWLLGIPLLAVLVLAMACGEDATPVVIEKEVIVEKEVVREVPKEVIVIKEVQVVKEVEVEVVKEVEVVREVEVEVVKEVVVVKEVEVLVTPTPLPGQYAMMIDSVSGNEATYGGIAMMSSVGDVRGWDPHKHGRGEDIHANGLAYNQLVEYNPLNVSQIIGDLAVDWDVSEDFRTYTFRINKGVKWHDGQDLTADDIVYSIVRLIGEGRSRAGLFRPYMTDDDPAVKVDSYTVQLNLKQPAGGFMQFLAADFNKMVPLHTAGAGKDLELYENYMGSGPWVPISWEEGVSYEWEANPNYFKEGRPGFGGIQGFQIVDVGIEIAAYRTQRIHMPMDTNIQAGVEDVHRLLEDEEFMAIHDLYRLQGSSHNNLLLNSQKAPFDQPEARRALFLATDRWQIMEGFGQGEWIIGASMTFKNPYGLPEEELIELPGYRRNADGSKSQEDIDEAIRLLNSIGFDDSNPMKFELIGSTHSFHSDAAAVVKEMYKNFGLPVDITIAGGEIGAVVGQAIEGDYQMMVLGCGVTIFDPDDSFYLCYMPTGRNWTRYTEPGSLELFLKQQVEPDPIKRREINYEMQRLIYAGSPATIEHSQLTRLNFINKRIRTQNGKWQNRLSNYTQQKHEHEWLLPAGSAIPGE